MTNKTPAMKNTATRLLTLLSILDEYIAEKDLIGIAMWSDEAFQCMIHIEVDNKFFFFWRV